MESLGPDATPRDDLLYACKSPSATMEYNPNRIVGRPLRMTIQSTLTGWEWIRDHRHVVCHFCPTHYALLLPFNMEEGFRGGGDAGGAPNH